MSQFAPELSLDRVDRAHLVQIATTEGFRVLQRIMRTEVDRFILAGINADPADEAGVLSAHRMAKAAAQFFQGVTDRINEEILQFNSAATATDAPIDMTAVLDLDGMAGQLEEELV